MAKPPVPQTPPACGGRSDPSDPLWILPAIDLLGGRCVRLLRGDYASARVYSEQPAEVARSFARAGARMLHLVDLDAARGGAKGNRQALAGIRRAFPFLIEVGGGVRAEEDIRALLDLGMDRLILGTALAREPERVARWCAAYGRALWGGIDALDGRVRVSGWEAEAGLQDTELARAAQALGVGGLIYTAIRRDGALSGPDLEATNRVAAACGLPVILSGGIGGPRDVAEVARGRHPRVRGLILGKALYEGKVDLAELCRAWPQGGGRAPEEGFPQVPPSR